MTYCKITGTTIVNRAWRQRLSSLAPKPTGAVKRASLPSIYTTGGIEITRLIKK